MEHKKSMESTESRFFGQQVPAPTINTFDFGQSSDWEGNETLPSNTVQSDNKDAQRYTKQPFKIQGRALPMEPGEATEMLLRQHQEDDTPSSEGWQQASFGEAPVRQAFIATDAAYKRASEVRSALRQQSPESMASTPRAAKRPRFRPLNHEERAEGYNLNKGPRIPRESKEGWSYVESLSRQRICAAAMDFAPKGATSVKLLKRPKGQNNLGAILQFDNGVKAVMRIPACGSSGWWDSNGKRTLRNTVEAMKYIKAHTGMKVPKVLDYSMTCDNKLGAPYLAMSFVDGKPVSDVWWDHQGMACSGDFVTVSPDLERKRQQILKSIANQVVELRKLKFPQSGYLKLEEGNVDKPRILFPTIRPFGDQVDRHKHNRRAKTAFINRGGDEADWISDDESIASRKMREAHTSSVDEHTESQDSWYKYALEEAESLYPGVNIKEDTNTQMIHGLHKVYSIMIGYLPHGAFTKEYPEPEKFSLFQSDFNPQNIFVDEECNVTGFIDWDLTDTRPCYVGWARIPLWLCEDWDFSHLGRAGKLSWPNPRMAYPASVDLQRYRRDYARYLLDACDRLDNCDDDWKYSLKCHILDAVLVTVGSETGVKFRFLERLFDQYIGTFGWKFHLEKIGREGFEPGLKDFYHRFFKDLFYCDADAVRAELQRHRPAMTPKADVAESVRSTHSRFADRLQAELETQVLHEELKNAYKEQLDFCREQIVRMQKLLELQHSEFGGSSPKSYVAQSASRSALSRSVPITRSSCLPQAATTQDGRPARPADILFASRAPNQALVDSAREPQRADTLAETFAVWQGKPPKCSGLEIGRPGIDLDPLTEEELRVRTALKDEEAFYADPSNYMMSGAIQTKSEEKRRWSDSFRKPARKAMKLLKRDSKSRKELQRLIEEGTMGAWRKKSSNERKDPASKPSSSASAAATSPPSISKTPDTGSQGNGSQMKDGSSASDKPGKRSSTGSQDSLMRRVANLLLKGYRDHPEKVEFSRDLQDANAHGNVPHHESMSRGIMVI